MVSVVANNNSNKSYNSTTVPDTFDSSHTGPTSAQSGGAAESAATNKRKKYSDIAVSHLFIHHNADG